MPIPRSVVVGAKHSGLDRLGRRTDTDLPRGQVAKYTGTSTNNRALTNRHTWGNIDIGRNPSPSVYDNRLGNKREVNIFVVVRGPTQIRVLAYQCVRAEFNTADVIHVNIIGNACVLGQFQSAWSKIRSLG
jgi:hypothetical protein